MELGSEKKLWILGFGHITMMSIARISKKERFLVELWPILGFWAKIPLDFQCLTKTCTTGVLAREMDIKIS